MATLLRWEPLRTLSKLQEEINELFGDRMALSAGESVGWTPSANVYEDENTLKVSFELAGVDPKDVEVRFENGTLTVKGERRLEKEEKKENYHRMEVAYGAFTRSFSLPGSIDAEKITAESKNGVLTVVVPKKSESKPKTVQVKPS